MSKINTAMNILQGVISYRKDQQQHANDIAQQAVNNAAAQQQEALALQALGTTNALNRRKLTNDFLVAQKQALANQGSALVNAAWQGIEGGTSQDILTAVMQDVAQTEVLRDEGLRAIYDESVARTAGIVANTANSMDHRDFTKPSVLASILGIGKSIIDDNRATGKIG